MKIRITKTDLLPNDFPLETGREFVVLAVEWNAGQQPVYWIRGGLFWIREVPASYIEVTDNRLSAHWLWHKTDNNTWLLATAEMGKPNFVADLVNDDYATENQFIEICKRLEREAEYAVNELEELYS